LPGLDFLHFGRYSKLMNDPTKRAPIDWLADIAESEAELAAGDIIPAETALRPLRERIARLDAKAVADRRGKAAPRR